MGIDVVENFDTAGNWAYDGLSLGVSGGVGKLLLVDDGGLEFSEGFGSSSGFTYSAAKTEFSGGLMQQKDVRPAGAAFYAPYSVDIHGGWGNGVLTGTGTGSPAIVGGKLDLTGSVNKFVAYAATGNVSAALQTGAIRFRVTPNYSGKPSSRQNFFSIGGANVNSNLTVYHDSSAGYIYVSIYNDSGSAIYSSYIQAGLYWTPVAGTEYEFELNYDVTGGDIRLFINGTLWGVAVSGTGTRSSANLSNIWIGAIRGAVPAPSNNFAIRNFLCFDTVQHTSNYTPDWSTIYDTIYVTDTITCPTHTYTGAGAIQAWESSTITDTASPRFIVNGFYWSGSAWVASSDTWATASPASDIAANIATLDASDTLIVKVVWNGSNTQQSVDTYVIEYTGQIYPTTNPTFVSNVTSRIEDLLAFSHSATITGSDNIKYNLSKDGVYYYYSGAAWVVANGTYAQSNTAAEVLTNAASFISGTVGAVMRIKIFVHSDDGTTTPEIESVSYSYDYYGDAPDAVQKCIVWGYLYNANSDASSVKVSAKLNTSSVRYKNYVMYDGDSWVTVTPNATTGYWELTLAENASMPAGTRWIFDIGNKRVVRYVPAVDTKNFNELGEDA